MLSKLCLIAAALTASVYGADWDYLDGSKGPHKWASLDPTFLECAGRRQSPINIETASVVDEPPEFLRLSAPVMAPNALTISNNGHTITLDVTPRHMSLVTSKVESKFDALQLHFHMPSEHTIDGKSYRGEVHLVTRSINHALHGGRPPFTVLGILYEEGTHEDPLLSAILAVKDKIGSKDKSADIMFALDYDLPEHFYEYQGSLTTPPCWETVNWMLATKPRTATKAQLDALETLMPMNARPTLARNSRVVTRTKYVSSDLSQAYEGCSMP